MDSPAASGTTRSLLIAAWTLIGWLIAWLASGIGVDTRATLFERLEIMSQIPTFSTLVFYESGRYVWIWGLAIACLFAWGRLVFLAAKARLRFFPWIGLSWFGYSLLTLWWLVLDIGTIWVN